MLRRLAARLKNEDGSIVSSIIFTMFTALVMATMVGAVVSTMNLTRLIQDQGSTDSEALVLQERLLASGAPGAEQCFSGTCLNGERSADGLSVTVRDGDGYEHSRTLKKISGTMIGGFDAAGNPVWVSGDDSSMRTFSSLAVFPDHSCALEPSGTAWCWGEGDRGQLGTGTAESSPGPAAVGDGRYTALAGDAGATCALDTSGAVWCWGSGTNGRLGNGSTADSYSPVRAGSGTYTSLAASSTTTCAVAGTDLSCWGLNTGGPASAVPVPVPGKWTSLTMDDRRTCALDTDGRAYCWSADADEGPEPAQVGSGTFTRLYLGGDTGCGLASSGDAWCWGPGTDGQLGDGTSTSSPSPVKVTGGHRFDSLAVSGTSVCGLSAGSIWCWGEGTSGQLGDGQRKSSPVPVKAVLTNPAASITAGDGSFCARTSDGISCWGSNTHRQSAPASTSDTPSPAAIPGSAAGAAVHTAGSSACTLDARRTVSCWGQTSGSPSAPAGMGSTAYTPESFTGYVRSPQ